MQEPNFRPLERVELDTLVEWAAREGWNPGLADGAAFWAADSEGFFGMELAGELIGGISIVSYEGEYGFVGLFIVKPEWRARGLGTKFWNFFIARLRERLKPAAPAGLDGVFAMQPYYAKSGFTFTHRHLRMEGIGQRGEMAAAFTNAAELSFDQVREFDRRYFPADRSAFLRLWLRPTGGRALGWMESGQLRGYGVIRPCRLGFKIGPLFAETAEIAESLFLGLSDQAAGEPIYLDVPEINAAAVALAERHGLREVFGCARMFMGPIPNLPWNGIYGVTTLELG